MHKEKAGCEKNILVKDSRLSLILARAARWALIGAQILHWGDDAIPPHPASLCTAFETRDSERNPLGGIGYVTSFKIQYLQGDGGASLGRWNGG